MPTALIWGRTERDYSRNRIVISLFADLGWDIDFFHPVSSQLGLPLSFIQRPARPDVVWVPCFRHRDIYSAAYWAKKWRVPLILDPLISAYEKEVYERAKWSPGSKKAEQRRRWEEALFATGDVVVADTAAHGTFFSSQLGVAPEKLEVLVVGAEEGLFTPRSLPPMKPPFELLFYGSFLELHGVDVIVEAAKQVTQPETRWVLLGDGDIKEKIQAQAADCPNIIFEPWIPYETLPDRIARAHILLGVFGPTVLSGLVIPNKMFQSMAMGRPVVTSYSEAYKGTLDDSDTIGWVPGGDSAALAKTVTQWLANPSSLEPRGKKTRQLFDTYFSTQTQRNALETILEKALARGAR
jgi:glycosyltransferase involved in cell wall biosynthesis